MMAFSMNNSLDMTSEGLTAGMHVLNRDGIPLLDQGGLQGPQIPVTLSIHLTLQDLPHGKVEGIQVLA